jgi:cytochrome c553
VANPDKGETMTKAICMACHGDTQAGQKRLAPPMMMVKRRYSALKKDERVEAMAKWAKKPDAKKTRMPGAVRNFGLMPPLPLPDADLQAIATYISKTEFAMPKGCGPGAVAGKGAQAGCDPTQCDPKNCDPKNCDPKKCGKGGGPGAGKVQGKGQQRGNGG